MLNLIERMLTILTSGGKSGLGVTTSEKFAFELAKHLSLGYARCSQ